MLDLLLPRRQAIASEPGYVGDATFTSRVVSLDEIRPTSSRVNVTMDVAMTYSAVTAATRLLSATPARLPLNLYRRLSGDGREIAVDDPRDTLVHSEPNPEMDAMPFRIQGFSQQVNAGNAYAEIERDRKGRAIALWPIHYTRVTLVRDRDTGKLIYEVKNDEGPPSYIPAADMLHVPSTLTDDGITGKGIIRYARESIGFGIVTERSGAAWFGHGGVPRVVVTSPAKWTPESRTNFRKEWKDVYGGPDGDKVALLTEGATLTPLNISQEDSQFLQTRQHNIEEIARWYGVPPHMLQHLLRATFNNIEHLGIEFVQYSLLPWLKLWEQQLAKKLLTPEERKSMFFEFNVNALMQGDSKTRSEFYRTGIFSGWMSPNEVRAYENMNPYEGGDVYVMQQAMVPIDKLGDIVDAQTAIPEPAPVDDTKDTKEAQHTATVMRAMFESSRSLKSRMNATAAETASAMAATTQALAELRAEMMTSRTVEVKPDGREAALQAAARSMLRGALSRMYRMQAAQARNAAGKPKEFCNWLDGFFGDKHRETFRDAIADPCQALIVLGIDIDVSALTITEVELSRSQLLEASGVVPAEFANTIEACVSDWEKNRAARVAESMLRHTK